ncbi:calcium-binding protein [Nocardioides sp. GXQ0305]|uniref:calcium-binding protein n=1 Tax=Nocardioides sp. GXQ0305 TaxID=3423912 RepID=UPI003D7E80BA
MARLFRRLVTATVAALAVTISLVALGSGPATADQPEGYGPADPFDDSIKPDDGPQESVRGQAKIARTRYGYRLTAAEQNSRLRITMTDNGRLRFRDTRVDSWKSLPRACDRQRVDPGVAATCRVPADATADDHALIEVRPRLGNDRVDGRGLPAILDMAVLGDAGRDSLYGGRGDDYLGGAMDRDISVGGAGKDWIRGGDSRDRLWGGADADCIVGMSGRDRIRGGSGVDRTFQ